jgi:hypothetical protein
MNPVTGLSLGRIAVGVVSVASPATAARLFGLDAAANPSLPVMTRLFGVREIAIGAATLTARGAVRRRLVLAGMAVDGGDAAASVVSVGNQEIGKAPGGVLTAVALGAVGAGFAGLRQDRRTASDTDTSD